MIRAAAKGNSLQLSLYFKDLLPYILSGLQSPLAAPYLSKLFTDLRSAVFTQQSETLGELIAFVTLRLSKPQCDLDANWEAENLNKAMVRTVSLIHERTVSKKSEENQTCFTVPAFCYTFVLLKSSLLSNYARNHDELVHDGLQIISEHAKLRANEQNGVNDVYDPQYLPGASSHKPRRVCWTSPLVPVAIPDVPKRPSTRSRFYWEAYRILLSWSETRLCAVSQ
jgi:hypothetical protein